jgi:endoglucanase
MSIHCVAWPRNRSVTVRLLALLAVGCGDDSHRLGGARDQLGLCAEGAVFESIDRMEDGDGTTERVAERSGYWFAFNDDEFDTGPGTQIPNWREMETFPMSELDPPRGRSSHFAARTYGGGFTDWGAGIGLELYTQQTYDLSKYAGVTFWARRAPNTTATLRFSLPDTATSKRAGQCEMCDDHFGSDLNLSTRFHRYSFTWQELKQENFGEPRPDALNTKEVYGLRFQVHELQDFDFWIDDVAFICKAD